MMSEIQTKDSGGGKKKKGGSKQKKISVFVDFTPMVDMNMLLITFFMLCTSLSKPQTMEINMPSNDKKITDADKSMVKASQAVTLLLTGGDSIFYYTGQPDYKDYNSLKLSSYKASGIRAFLLKRNSDAVSKIDDLKQKKLQLKMTQDQFTKQASEIKNGKNTPVVIIKATDKATYKNLIDALDEMQICNIGKYVIDTIAASDRFLLKNRAAKGAFSRAGGK
ncbi:MAG: biopolymer transporter ExbD [Bacteroidota bacterium]|nr:biopolymer transporter ExbD [Bacteroidota bacterium]